MQDKKPIQRDDTVQVPLTIKDRDLIKKHSFLDPEIEQTLDRARHKNKGLIIDITLDDLDLLLGSIAAAANHAEDPDLQETLDEIYEKLSIIEGAYMLIEKRDGS
jgi:hypothetical protein